MLGWPNPGACALNLQCNRGDLVYKPFGISAERSETNQRMIERRLGAKPGFAGFANPVGLAFHCIGSDTERLTAPRTHTTGHESKDVNNVHSWQE